MTEIQHLVLRRFFMTTLLSTMCLILPSWSAQAALSCKAVITGIKSVLVEKRFSKSAIKSENEFQEQALQTLKDANLYGEHFYKEALSIGNQFQLKVLQELIQKKIYSHFVWEGLKFVTNDLQRQAFFMLLGRTYEFFTERVEYIAEIQTPEQIGIFQNLLNTNARLGHQFWFKLNEKRILSDFKTGLSVSDISAFTKSDGIPPSIRQELEMMLLRFAKRESVIGKVEVLAGKSSYFLKDDEFYVEIEIRRSRDRLQIGIHEMNIDPRVLRKGQRVNSLNQKASEFMAVILLFAARQAKQFSEIQEIEILAQDIVNEDLVWALRKRLFHAEDRKDIPDFGKHEIKQGAYLRASILISSGLTGKDIPALAFEVLNHNHYDSSLYRTAIENFDNIYQYWAIRELAQKRENVQELIESVSRFKNQHQVRALQILTDSNQNLLRFIGQIEKFENEHQVQALSYLVSTKNQLPQMVETLAQVQTSEQVRAFENLIRK